jgi:hypothetical protein
MRKRIIANMRRAMAGKHPPKTAAVTEPLPEYTWTSFDPGKVIRVLLDREPSYPGHKGILLAGFYAWLISPDKDRHPRYAMAREALHILGIIEAGAKKRISFRDPIINYLFCIMSTGYDFYGDFYLSVGGIAEISEAPTTSAMRGIFKKRSKEIDRLIALIYVFHIHSEHLSDAGRYHKGSVIKGVKAARMMASILEKKISSESIKNAWSMYSLRAPMLYASVGIIQGKKALLRYYAV